MLRMTVEGVGFDGNQKPVVVLKDWEGLKVLPIWIGPSEAKAIALELENAKSPRPFSHDLLLTCIELRGGKVSRVTINDLQDATFYATIDIDMPNGMQHIDSRPSDAIALALRAKCAVFVDGDALHALVDVEDATNIESEREAGVNDETPPEPDLSALEDIDPNSEIARFKRLIGELDLQE